MGQQPYVLQMYPNGKFVVRFRDVRKVLEIVVLPDEVIAFCVTSRSLQVARSPIAQQELAELAARSVRGNRDALSRLYAMFVRPAEGAIERQGPRITPQSITAFAHHGPEQSPPSRCRQCPTFPRPTSRTRQAGY